MFIRCRDHLRIEIETEEDRATGYYIAHSVLIVVNVAIAVVLGRWGWRALRASRQES